MSERVEACPSCGSENTSCVVCDEWQCWACDKTFYASDCDCLENEREREDSARRLAFAMQEESEREAT
jgi:hypothetical protein